jgi:hypothetical protein
LQLFNVDPARIAMMPAALIETEFPEGMTLSWSLSDVTLPFKKNQVSIPAGLYVISNCDFELNPVTSLTLFFVCKQPI